MHRNFVIMMIYLFHICKEKVESSHEITVRNSRKREKFNELTRGRLGQFQLGTVSLDEGLSSLFK